MRKYLRGLMAAAGLMLGTLGAVAPTYALVVPGQFAPRLFPWQMVHYMRIDVKFNAMNGIPCVLVSNACTIKVGALPYNSMLLRASQQIVTSFNSGTTDTLAIGITSTSANELVAAQSVHGAAGNPSSLTIVSGNGGVSVLGNSTTQTGADGGFDIYVKYAQTGAAPTAGQAILVLEYIAPNDGDCTTVPMGATAGAC